MNNKIKRNDDLKNTFCLDFSCSLNINQSIKKRIVVENHSFFLFLVWFLFWFFASQIFQNYSSKIKNFLET